MQFRKGCRHHTSLDAWHQFQTLQLHWLSRAFVHLLARHTLQQALHRRQRRRFPYQLIAFSSQRVAKKISEFEALKAIPFYLTFVCHRCWVYCAYRYRYRYAGSSFLPVFWPMSNFFCKYPRTLSEKRVWLPLGFWSAQPIRSEFTSVVVSIWTSFWRRDFLLGSSDFSGKTEPNRFVTSHTRPAVPSSLGCDLQSHLDEFPALHD